MVLVRTRAIVVAALVAVLTLPAGGPARASSPWAGPQLLALAPPVIAARTPTWVAAFWLTGSPVCRFRLVVAGHGLLVGYPSNTGWYSSFYRADWLGELASDYTAFRVTAQAGNDLVPLRLELSYIQPGPGYRPGGACVGRHVTRIVTVPLGVLDDAG